MKKDITTRREQKTDIATRQLEWWTNLTDTWKLAFSETIFQQKTMVTPTASQLKTIWELSTIRMAGPSAMFPNMSVALEDLSGISQLTQLQILIITHHNFESIEEIAGLTSLHSLFIFSNRIKVLRGVEKIKGLKKLYFNDNMVTTLQALSTLTTLETVHCANNKITSLKGIGKQHKALQEFYCLPNDGIWQSEIIRFEAETKIRCLKG